LAGFLFGRIRFAISNEVVESRAGAIRAVSPPHCKLKRLKIMTNSLTTTTGTALVDRGQDPLEQFANAVAQTGQPLKFSKGRWFTGFGDSEKPADGMRLIADVPTIMLGWRKWVSKKIVDARIGYIADGFHPPARHDLDDTEEQTWERNSRGDAQDPWSYGVFLRLKNPEDGEDYIYSAVSKGGQKAIWKLLQAFVKRRKVDPERCIPVVSLEADSYRHRDFGKVDTPQLTIIDWASDEAATAMPDPDGSDDAEMSDTIPF
jgi:hypothetical protein